MHTMKGYSASSASSSRIVDFASIDSASTMRVLAALQIDRAVDVDALAPARLLDSELLFLGRPAAHGPRRMGRMHRVHEHRDFVVAHGIHQVFVARNERLLRFRIELARDDFGLVIFESQAMQQRDQARAAFVDEAEFLGDPGADLARRARQSRPDPGLQGLALLDAHFARAAAHLEAAEPFDAALLEKLIPAADRVVVEQENFGHFLTAHTLIQQHYGVGAPRHATGRPTIARQSDQRLAILFTEKAAPNHAAIRIQPSAKRKLFPDSPMSRGIFVLRVLDASAPPWRLQRLPG